MNTKTALLGLIAATTVVFFFAYALSAEAPLGIGALLLGLLWLALEIKNVGSLSTLFFLFFLGLALWGTLQNLPIPVLLVGVSTDLAAWDLSRFRTRITDGVEEAIDLLLETKHLQTLSVAIGVGFMIAVLPLVISFSISFVALVFLTLLIMLILRRSVFYLRG